MIIVLHMVIHPEWECPMAVVGSYRQALREMLDTCTTFEIAQSWDVTICRVEYQGTLREVLTRHLMKEVIPLTTQVVWPRDRTRKPFKRSTA